MFPHAQSSNPLPESVSVDSVRGISGSQSIDDLISIYPHDKQSLINIYPAQELRLAVDDSDASLRPLIKYMEGNNFDLRGISEFLSSPDLDPKLQCAALQLLEHAAESQSANFTECMPVTFGPVAKLVLHSKDIQVHCAALDTMKLFLTSPYVTDNIESMMSHDLVAVISDDLNSPSHYVQLASVELLEAASQSKEILIGFATAISSIPSALSSMPIATQMTALKVLEISAGSNIPALVNAVTDSFNAFNMPRSQLFKEEEELKLLELLKLFEKKLERRLKTPRTLEEETELKLPPLPPKRDLEKLPLPRLLEFFRERELLLLEKTLRSEREEKLLEERRREREEEEKLLTLLLLRRREVRDLVVLAAYAALIELLPRTALREKKNSKKNSENSEIKKGKTFLMCVAVCFTALKSC